MKPRYALAGSLSNATQVGGVWGTALLTLNVIDKEGVHLLSNAAVGDNVFIDTSAVDSGSYANYRITGIVSRSGTVMVANATYASAGTAPDLSWCINADVVVTRSDSSGFGIPAPKTQGINDKLPFGLLSQSLSEITAGKSVTGITFSNGKVSGYSIGSDVFVCSYGANGLSGITKNGAAYVTLSYTNGVLSAINNV